MVDKVHLPTAAEILNINPATKARLNLIQFASSTKKTEQESVFRAFGLQVNSIELIQEAYLRLKLQYADATHIMLGYRIDCDGEVIFGSNADGEHTGDAKINELLYQENMVNIAVFVLRWYGGIHLGGTRLTIIYQQAKQITDQFPFLKGKDPPAAQGQDSESGSESDGAKSENQDDAVTDVASSENEEEDADEEDEEETEQIPEPKRQRRVTSRKKNVPVGRGRGRGKRNF